MLFTNKLKIALFLEKTRPVIDRMIKKGLIKEVKNDKGVKVGYVIVIEFINYLTTK